MDPMIPIPLPYNLKHDEIALEVPPNDGEPDAAEDFHWFLENIQDREAQERVFRSTTILLRTFPEADLRHCFNTALIWEAG